GGRNAVAAQVVRPHEAADAAPDRQVVAFADRVFSGPQLRHRYGLALEDHPGKAHFPLGFLLARLAGANLGARPQLDFDRDFAARRRHPGGDGRTRRLRRLRRQAGRWRALRRQAGGLRARGRFLPRGHLLDEMDLERLDAQRPRAVPGLLVLDLVVADEGAVSAAAIGDLHPFAADLQQGMLARDLPRLELDLVVRQAPDRVNSRLGQRQ